MTSSDAPQAAADDSLDELRQQTLAQLPDDCAWGRLSNMQALRRQMQMELPDDPDLRRLLLSLFQVQSLIVQLEEVPTGAIVSRNGVLENLRTCLSHATTSQP